MYSFLIKQINMPYTKNTLHENYKKILITMTPIIPHFANECLELINVKDQSWPEIDNTMLKDDLINIVIQINGKKRGLIKTKPSISEEKLFDIINKDETLTKYFNQKKIKRKIYIKDKLLNIIV